MNSWNCIRLGDVCYVNTEAYSEKERWDYVHYLDTGNITKNCIDEIQYIDLMKEKLPSRARRKVQYTSILYSTVRPNQCHYGIVKEQSSNFLVSTGFSVIDVIDERVDADFLYCYLTMNAVTEKMHAIAEQSTSAYPAIKSSDIEDLELKLPDILTQKRIASFLMSLEHKITNNTKLNKNLEEQARAIFDSFYLKSEDKIPFTQMIKVLSGGTPKTTERAFWCGQIPFFTPKDVGNPYVLETEKYVTELGLTNCNSRLYPVNTTFVTARGTVGKVSLAGIPMAMNQSCYALMSDALHPFMTYFYTLHTVKTLQHKATGAVFDAIVTSDFDSELLHRIPEDDASQLLRRISPMMENIRVNVVGNLRLTELRDALLPRLMSGEIDVSNITL